MNIDFEKEAWAKKQQLNDAVEEMNNKIENTSSSTVVDNKTIKGEGTTSAPLAVSSKELISAETGNVLQENDGLFVADQAYGFIPIGIVVDFIQATDTSKTQVIATTYNKVTTLNSLLLRWSYYMHFAMSPKNQSWELILKQISHDGKTEISSTTFTIDFPVTSMMTDYKMSRTVLITKDNNERGSAPNTYTISGINDEIDYFTYSAYGKAALKGPREGSCANSVPIFDTSKFDAENKLITNLADPISDQDAVTLNYLKQNGSTGSGDMLAETYDPQNKKTDAFKFENFNGNAITLTNQPEDVSADAPVYPVNEVSGKLSENKFDSHKKIAINDKNFYSETSSLSSHKNEKTGEISFSDNSERKIKTYFNDQTASEKYQYINEKSSKTAEKTTNSTIYEKIRGNLNTLNQTNQNMSKYDQLSADSWYWQIGSDSDWNDGDQGGIYTLSSSEQIEKDTYSREKSISNLGDTKTTYINNSLLFDILSNGDSSILEYTELSINDEKQSLDHYKSFEITPEGGFQNVITASQTTKDTNEETQFDLTSTVTTKGWQIGIGGDTKPNTGQSGQVLGNKDGYVAWIDAGTAEIKDISLKVNKISVEQVDEISL